MEFFGLTSFGASDPIKFSMRPDYTEPETAPHVIDILNKGEYTRPLYEVVRDLDIYSGILDGNSYRSHYRLKVHRERAYYKSVGPKQIYRDCITKSMDYGWFENDPALKDKTWFKNDVHRPLRSSETTRFLNTVLKTDPTFVL